METQSQATERRRSSRAANPMMVAVFTERPARLGDFAAEMARIVPRGSYVWAWVPVQLFCAPASTPLPYRGRALLAAREITVERGNEARRQIDEAVASLSRALGWQVEADLLTNLDPGELASRLTSRHVQLLVVLCGTPDRATSRLLERVRLLSGCPLLLIGAGDQPQERERRRDSTRRRRGKHLLGWSR